MAKAGNKVGSKTQAKEAKFISPAELADRWRCARSTVDRIVQREGMSRMFLGEGKNGIVRLLMSEVTAYETKRTVK